MKFATLKSDSLDGKLVLVSRDLKRAVDATVIAPNLITALQHWDALLPALTGLSEALNAHQAPNSFAFEPEQCVAPLPRSHNGWTPQRF